MTLMHMFSSIAHRNITPQSSSCERRRNAVVIRSSHGPEKRSLAPWSLTFDLRERETLWTQENQARLVKIVASYELELDIEDIEERLREIASILPNLTTRLAFIKPGILANLLRDPDAIVPRLISLKNLLPAADISKMAAEHPELLLLRDLDVIESDVRRVKALLETDAMDLLAALEPRILDAEGVEQVLHELKRLLPSTERPSAVLRGDPSWMTRVERGRQRLGDDPD